MDHQVNPQVQPQVNPQVQPQVQPQARKAKALPIGGKVMFSIIKNIIIEQNKLLLQKIASQFDIDEQHLIETYLKPEYYLPVVLRE
jgi:hypothetical protein